MVHYFLLYLYMRKLKEMIGLEVYNKLRRQKYFQVNKEKIYAKARVYVKKRLLENPDIKRSRYNQKKEYLKRKRLSCPLKVRKEKLIKVKKIRILLTDEEKKERAALYRLKNKDKLIEYRSRPEVRFRKNELQRSRKESPEQRKKRLDNKKVRRLCDPLFKLKETLRKSTADAFNKNRWHKCGSTEKILGISYELAKQHIERQFTAGMSWDNHGMNGWHIDHKIPLASAKTEEDLRALCHYTNLQPLWAKENLEKSDKILSIQTTLMV